jgi:uncharacterized protein (DUF927 family)
MAAPEINVFDELASFLAAMDPEKVLAYHASTEAQQRMDELQWKNKESTLNDLEKQEMERYLVVEHIVRPAKIHARQRLSVA